MRRYSEVILDRRTLGHLMLLPYMPAVHETDIEIDNKK